MKNETATSEKCVADTTGISLSGESNSISLRSVFKTRPTAFPSPRLSAESRLDPWPVPLSSVETTERVVWADIFSSRRIKRRACAERLTKKKSEGATADLWIGPPKHNTHDLC